MRRRSRHASWQEGRSACFYFAGSMSGHQACFKLLVSLPLPLSDLIVLTSVGQVKGWIHFRGDLAE